MPTDDSLSAAMWAGLIRTFVHGQQVAVPYVEDKADAAVLAELSDELLLQLRNLCDLNPLGATTLIKFVIEVIDEATDLGHFSAEDDSRDQYERGRNDQYTKMRRELEELIRKGRPTV